MLSSKSSPGRYRPPLDGHVAIGFLTQAACIYGHLMCSTSFTKRCSPSPPTAHLSYLLQCWAKCRHVRRSNGPCLTPYESISDSEVPSPMAGCPLADLYTNIQTSRKSKVEMADKVKSGECLMPSCIRRMFTSPFHRFDLLLFERFDHILPTTLENPLSRSFLILVSFPP